MKKLFVLVMVLLCKLSIAQNVQPLEANPNKIDADTKHILYNNSIYYLTDKSEIDTITNLYHNSEISIVKFDKQLVKTTKRINVDSTKSYYTNRFIDMYKDTLYIILFEYNSTYVGNYTQGTPFLVKADTNLNIKSYTRINALQNILTYSCLFKVLTDTTAVFNYFPYPNDVTHTETILLNTQIADTIKTRIDSLPNLKSWVSTKDSLIHLMGTTGDYLTVDYHLNKISHNQLSILPNYIIDRPDYSSVYLKNKPLYYSYLDSNAKTLLAIYTYDFYTNNSQLIYSEDFPNSTYINGSLWGVDVLDSSYIFATYLKGGTCANPSNFASMCTNNFDVSKITPTGTLLWKKSIGFDAAYFVNQVIATPDSGCLVFVQRFQYGFNHNENDEYYIKLDKNGNQQIDFLPNAIPSLIIEDDLVLYPNPTSDFLMIKNQNLLTSNCMYTITSLDGKLIKSESLINNKIDVNELITGEYVLTIKDKNKFILHKKFMKK